MGSLAKMATGYVYLLCLEVQKLYPAPLYDVVGKGILKIIAACTETYVANRVHLRVREGSIGALVWYLYGSKRFRRLYS